MKISDEVLKKIFDSGHHVEVKPTKDGYIVLEVMKKTIERSNKWVVSKD